MESETETETHAQTGGRITDSINSWLERYEDGEVSDRDLTASAQTIFADVLEYIEDYG